MLLLRLKLSASPILSEAQKHHTKRMVLRERSTLEPWCSMAFPIDDWIEKVCPVGCPLNQF